jgi:hypothetical protein
MEGISRIWFTPKQRSELWERWKSGEARSRPRHHPPSREESITTHYFGNTCARRCSLGSSPGAVFSRAVMRAIAVTP